MTKQVETVNLGILYICVRFYRLHSLAVCHKPLPNPTPTPIQVPSPIPVSLKHLSLRTPPHHSAPRAPAPNFWAKIWPFCFLLAVTEKCWLFIQTLMHRVGVGVGVSRGSKILTVSSSIKAATKKRISGHMLPQSKGIGQQPIVTIAVTKKREQCVWHAFLLAPRIKKDWYLWTNKLIQKEIQCTFTLSRNCVVAEQDHMQGIKCMLLLIVLLQKPFQTKKIFPFSSDINTFLKLVSKMLWWRSTACSSSSSSSQEFIWAWSPSCLSDHGQHWHRCHRKCVEIHQRWNRFSALVKFTIRSVVYSIQFLSFFFPIFLSNSILPW